MHQNNPLDYLLGVLGALTITASISFGQEHLIPGLFSHGAGNQSNNNFISLLSTTWSSQLSCQLIIFAIIVYNGCVLYNIKFATKKVLFFCASMFLLNLIYMMSIFNNMEYYQAEHIHPLTNKVSHSFHFNELLFFCLIFNFAFVPLMKVNTA